MRQVICYPGIVNPGPVIPGLYQNARGFVPFSGLSETVLPLSTTKLHDFQSSVYSRDPGLGYRYLMKLGYLQTIMIMKYYLKTASKFYLGLISQIKHIHKIL